MMANNQSLNDTHLIENTFWDISYVLAGPCFALVSTTICMVILNTKLKNLHQYLKLLLNVLCVHNIICMIIAICLLTYMIISKIHDLGKYKTLFHLLTNQCLIIFLHVQRFVYSSICLVEHLHLSL